jgi:outer membrane protein TolC
MTLFTWKFQRPPVTSTAARYTSAMDRPQETAWGPHQHFPDFTLRIVNAIANICLGITLLLALTCWGFASVTPAQGAETAENLQTPTPGGPLTFNDSVGIALTQSAYFKKSSTEIEIKKMDETDSRYGMIPTLTFSSIYYVNYPSGRNINSNPYTLNFITDEYNPVAAYLNLQARKLATRAAIFGHLKVISEGLRRLGTIFLELDALKKMAAYQQEIVSLSRENLTYAQNRLRIGTGTSLEVKLAQQELQLAQTEQDQMAHSRQRLLANLKNFIGLKPGQKITPDLHNAPHQVLGNFTPSTATLTQAKNRSYDLKITEIQKKLQSYNVKLAIARIFPTIRLNAQTPDPLSNTNLTGFYVGVGVQVPVWDGFSRVRNVSRQKAILRQFDSEIITKEDDLEDKWRGTLGVIQDKNMALKIAQSREELARLKDHQNEIRYESGEVRLPKVLSSRKDVLQAQKDTVQQSLEYNKAVLNLREISGDLANAYVRASSFQD